MEKRRTRGMTAIAVLNVVFGGLGILNGLFQLLGAFALMYELLRLGVFEIPIARSTFSLLILTAGVVGLIAGIGMFALRPWARPWSLAFSGLLILSTVSSFFMVPIIASIGTYDVGSVTAYDLVRLVIFSAIYIAIPVIYAPLLFVVFYKPAWKTAFAKGSAA